MVEPPPLSDYEVIKFLVQRGGSCTNYELVSNFRKILDDPQHQAEARLKFKDIINSVATVAEFQNVKYIELKKEYFVTRQQGEAYQASGHSSLPTEANVTPSYNSPLTNNFQPYWRYRLSTSPHLPPPKKLDTLVAPQSQSLKSFNRSISETTLTEERPTRTVRSSSEVQSQSPSLDYNFQLHNYPKEYNDHLRSSSNSNEIYTHAAKRHSSSHFYPEPAVECRMPSSLSFVSSNQATCEPKIERVFQKESSPLKCRSDNSRNVEQVAGKEILDKVSTLHGPRSSGQNDFKNFDQIPSHHLSESFSTRNIFASPVVINKNNNDSDSFRFSRSNSECSFLNAEKTVKTPFTRLASVSVGDEHGFSEQDEDTFVALKSASKMYFEKNAALQNSVTRKNERMKKNTDGHQYGGTWPVGDPLDNQVPPCVSAESGKETRCTDDFVPVPPERRRRSQDHSQKGKDDIEVTGEVKSNKVKDRVQHFDEMEKKQRTTPTSGGKENKMSFKHIHAEDDLSISVLDPKLKKEWFVKASQSDYHALVALLKKEPKLAALKDVASGYTALHWAAKHGDANVVKLIAGAYKVSPNIRSNGGYTPVHLASLYKHNMIGHLLIHTYGADPSLRDYSGKRADQYPSNYVRVVAGQKNVERRPLKQRPLVAKEPSGNSFMRIGSLNLRKARKSTVFASNRNWGTASELGFGSTRKKREKKSVVEDSDSDSAYGFYSKN